VGFLVNSLFHETKIPTVDMKVQVCSKFRIFFFLEKVKSPLSMNFGRISTSKCRGKLQKMEVLYTHSPKSPGPSSKLPKIHFSKIKKSQKNGNNPIGPGVDPWLTVDRRTATFGRRAASDQRLGLGRASGQLLLVGSSTCPPCPDFSLKLQTPITFDP
jgi:hypothetical protein